MKGKESVPDSGNCIFKSMELHWGLRRATKYTGLKASGEAMLWTVGWHMGGDKAGEALGTRSSKIILRYCISPHSTWKPWKVTQLLKVFIKSL